MEQNALVANAKLKDELQVQSIGVDNLMQRVNKQAKFYRKMVSGPVRSSIISTRMCFIVNVSFVES